MTHKGTITLETERLILRRFTVEDAEAMFRNWCADPDVTKYLMWPTHNSIDESRKVLEDIWLSYYDEPNFYQWAIEVKDIHEPIGSIGVVKSDDKTQMVHIGYCIGKAWWHKGYTSEALIRLVRFFFEDVGVNRIESRHDPRNPNSGKVMQKAGLLYEGTSLQSDWNNQGICDAANYAILARDYLAEQRKPQKCTFAPYNLIADREFLITAHKETFKLTFKQDIKLEWLDAELEKPRDVRDGAYLDGTLVGVCDLQRRSAEGNDDYGKVNFYYIAPEYRNRGLGGQLIAHSVAWCRSQGLKTLTLNTGKENFQAQKCYEHNGFVRFPQIDTDDEWGYVKEIEVQ